MRKRRERVATTFGIPQYRHRSPGGDLPPPAKRDRKRLTIRAYFAPRHGGGPGVHPLDVVLGLTRDGYSPLVIGWFCRLATRVSFQVASGLGEMFLGAAPPTSAIEEWVLGLGRPAYVYLSDGPLPEKDGDVLVIEVDGKAAPTATEEELGGVAAPSASTNAAASVSGIGAGRNAGIGGGRKRRKIPWPSRCICSAWV